MKYVDEYRSAELARGLASEIAGLVQPGETWNFQAWFRDVGDAPAHNTTNGVQLTWCP